MQYYRLNEYLKEQFGGKVYKVALDGGMTCPNRDGNIDTRGCIFCAGGSGSFAERQNISVTMQIENAKKRIEKKAKNARLIAYFQSYTNTYAPVEYLKKLFTEAISHPEVVALSIGTRPDCLPPEVMALLAELNEIKPVWVELGLQTMHPKTAAYIRRGYPLSVFDRAVKELGAIGVHVIVHMILGLPGETKEMMVQTARYIGESGADGIKLQLLHLLSGTDLEKDYREGKFSVLSKKDYFDCLATCLAVLPQTMVIHRMTGDGDKKLLVAPLWSGDKKQVLADWNRYMEAHHVRQGSLLE